MVKKYNKTIITGDLHLGDCAFTYEKELVETLKKDNYDCVVFGGDTFDPWRGQSIRDLISRYDLLFKFLQKLKSRVVFIKGNHDQDIDFLKKLGFSVRNRLKYISADNKKVKIIHGHEFDRDHLRWEFVTKRAVYWEERINEFLQNLNCEYKFRFIKLLGNIDLQRGIKNFQEKINNYKNIDTLIFGHSHLPWVGQKQKVQVFNWGGWQGDFHEKPRLIINKGNKFEMVELK